MGSSKIKQGTFLTKQKIGNVRNNENNGYQKGSIVRLKLENFLTYDSVELSPGPHLNLIIGPNGTGKSTIVCAICLGLGGKTSVIGRANHVVDYIKHGCNKASTTIELFNPDGRNWVITREITENNSTWKINDASVSLKDVENLVMELNIQVGNLCQFLPQDRVADFVRMNKHEMLENTEKALDGFQPARNGRVKAKKVGPPVMHEYHCQLKELRVQTRTVETSFKNTKEYLENEKQKIGRLEDDVKYFQERQRHLERIEILNKKRCWIEYEEVRQQYVQEKEKKDVLNKKIKYLRDKNTPLEKKLSDASGKVQELDSGITILSQEAREYGQKVVNRTKQFEEYGEKIQEVVEEFNLKKQTEEDRKQRIYMWKQQLEGLENELESLSVDHQDVFPLLSEVSKEIAEVSRKIYTIGSEKENVKTSIEANENRIKGTERHLNKIKDVGCQRLEMLRRKNKSAYDAVIWLRENEQKYKKKIYEPIMLQINVKNPEWAKYVEAQIPFNDMIAFVCEDEEDLESFMKTLRDEQNLKINVVMAPKTSLDSFKPPFSIANFKKFGFHHYLQDLFEAPNAVMRYLCHMHHVHCVPVGNKFTKDNVECIINQTPFKRFFTENHLYSVRKSRYTNQLSTISSEMRKADLLALSVDTTQVHHLSEKLQIFQEELKLWKAKHFEYEQEEKQLNVKQEELRRKKNCLESHKKKVKLALFHAEAVTNKLEAEREIFEASTTIQEAEQQLEQVKEVMDNKKNEAHNLLDIAKKITGIHPNEELPEDLKKFFAQLPQTVDEIDNEIHKEQAKADCLLQTDESVVQEYKQKKQEIKKIEKEFCNKMQHLEQLKKKIEEIKQLWLPCLEELISHINMKFRKYFAALGCAGEVTLSTSENPEDFENYGVLIRVKYRDTEELKELTPYHQSGGERSVATVLYMMALQEMTKVPFRCVDEINQGMDSRNERRVFELVVQTACLEATSQYFLLTPKLLPDLAYAENMTILFIHNGPKMLNHTQWNLQQFLQRQIRLTE
ncbi:structural maintenance of chromosomes protein 5-like isoform X3 [Limulus polyphemus]|uniref:Structural maintenance of chromosomes protein 5 n=1 Tax=Limulus polyphemus TaxID=6850 RepID=A0ABM1SLE7_LIMPO|nr:structural maintenance of chromosomes protein 5-like isoform X3 [Limulus polyphemus]